MSKEQAAEEEYRNKSVNNQRGASIEVNNTTDKEAIKISQYSGSNLKIENLVTSELAVNNKQTKVNNDSFETVLNNKCVWAGKDSVNRVVENTYELKGVGTEDEIDAAREWKEAYRPIANKNSEFEILRGGQSFPNGVITQSTGERADNPTKNQDRKVIDDVYPFDERHPGVEFEEPEEPVPPGWHPPAQLKPAYDPEFLELMPPPIVTTAGGLEGSIVEAADEVTAYTHVTSEEGTGELYKKKPSEEDIESGSGDGELYERPASNAVGVVEYGPAENAGTEEGLWMKNPSHQALPASILAIQSKLIPIEQRMGNGGDVEEFTYRNKLEVVGATTNDYPSVRIDPEGRSHPAEVTVGLDATYVNVDSTPHVEEVNNDANFPVGDYTLTVGNKYNVIVGSGGVQIKTSGAVEIGGTTLKVSAHKIHIQSSAGVNVSSENIVELQSEKNIALRSGRQILIEPGLGVRDNVIVGGATYTEGETYLHHVTAPAEIQQTEQTQVYGRLMPGLTVQATLVGGLLTILAPSEHPTGQGIECAPHSHHFKNLPLRLTDSSNSVREIAQGEGINVSDYQTAARGTAHELKQPTNWEEEKENQKEAISPEEA